MTNQDIIRIKNAVFYAYHGVDKDEQRLGGKFEVDIEMTTDFSEAAKSDNLNLTVDYEKIYSLLKSLVNEKKYFLLESLASSIADRLLEEYRNISKVMVNLRKPHPPVKGVVDYVEVAVSRKRN